MTPRLIGLRGGQGHGRLAAKTRGDLAWPDTELISP